MATVRCWALHGNINDAIYYVLDVKGNGEKTENKYFECTSGNAYSAGYDWQIKSGRDKEDTNAIVGFHFQQSFEAGSVSKEEAYEISKKWIEKIVKDEYDYVIAMHTDTKNIHTHIIVNPVNKKTGKQMQIFYKKDLPKFKMISDTICKENGLSILDNPNGKGKSYYEWMMENKGDSLKDIVKKTLDFVVEKVSSYDELKKYLTALGYTVEDGINIKEDEFTFTGDIKLVYSQNDDKMKVRLPYTKEFIYINKSEVKWLKENKTFKITYKNSRPVEIFNAKGEMIREVPVQELNLFWENKNNFHGRQGLRIKVPGSKTMIRCNRIDDEEKKYSLSDIIERIENNGRLACDADIKNVIESGISKSDQIDKKRQFYEDAGIKTKWKNSSFYRMSKKERYIAYKTNQIQKKLDAIHDIRELSDIIKHLDEYKGILASLKKDFKRLNDEIRDQEKILSEIQSQKMENILDVTQEEVDQYIYDNIQPLYKTKKELSERMRRIEEKIRQAEAKKEKENQLER